MKRRSDSSPHSRPPQKKRLLQTPDTLLPNPSSPDSSESSVASSSGKMKLSFLNDKRWSIASDAILLGELKKARTQQDGYLGLLWTDERMWEKIRMEVNADAPFHRTLDEIMDRVEKYKRAYGLHGDRMLRDVNYDIRTLVKDVFDKSVEISTPIDPRNRSRSRSRTTSHSRQLSIDVSTARGGGNTSQSHEDRLYEALASLDEVKNRGDKFLADCMFKLVIKSLDKAFLALRNDAQELQFLKILEG